MSAEPKKAAEAAEAGGKKLSRKEKKAAKENVIGGVTEEKLKADQKKKEKEEEAVKAQEEAKKGKAKGKERFETKTAETDSTPAGQKKDMSQPMADAYYPQLVESAWDLWWEKQGYFTAKPEDLTSDKEKFVIVIPPPNVTGTLHIGHALTNSIEDVLVRWNRMCGKVTLWVPGSDHAGIATQVVVEKQLKKTTGQSRHDLGREKFLERVWAWKEESGNTIFKQLRRLGVSVDWSRAAFTMDEPRSKAVQEAFIRMFNSEKIYRSNRLVSWSCALRTAISNIEVDYKDISTITQLKVPGYEEPVEFGAIHSFRYALADGSGHVTVATTRIETMLGDVAVAVHSSDPRYQKFIGKDLVHPFVPDRKIKVIADDVLVDPKFGTGAVKVTPGHDPNDFECGMRNKLQFINIFTDDGAINEHGGRFKGTPRFVARKVIIEELKKLGQYVGVEPNAMRLGFCSRSGDVIEPVIRPQWWVRTGGMAKKAADAVRNGELQLIPPNYNDTWFRWLDNNQDWCISRQLWWGHRIPAYQVTYNGRPAALAQEDAKHMFDDVETASWVAANSEAEALAIAAKKFPSLDRAHFKATQDDDVLDTWFSSGLFPFSVFNWPDQTLDLRAFYPNTLLETGHDILFFWVARMVMMGQELMGSLPFSKVYLHGLVRDKDGKKMSKSKGNVIDPLDIINGVSLEKLENNIKSGNLDKSELERALANVRKEFSGGIAECGSDALRFGLLSYVSGGRDINLDVLRIVAYRQFCNKLWNATKFGIDRFGSDFQRPHLPTVQKTKFSAFADRWILSRLHACVETVDKAMKNYEFADATQAIFDFSLKELCDVYLEAIKPRMYADVSDPAAAKTRLEALTVLYTCYDRVLRLLHPMMPFLTEELYQRLPDSADKAAAKSPSIMIAPYPLPADSAAWADPTVESDMNSVMELIRTTRSARASLGLAPKQKINVHIFTSSKPLAAAFGRGSTEISVLCNAAVVDVLEEESKVPAGCLSTVVNAAVTVHIPLQGLLDLSDELLKLDRKTTTILKSLSALEKSMNAPGYEKTPEKVRSEHKAKVDAQREELAQLRQSIATFESMVSLDTLRALHAQKLEGLNKDLAAADKEIADAEKKLAEDAAKPEADKLKEKARAKLEELVKTKQQDAQAIKAAIAAAEAEFQAKAAAKAKK